MTNNQLTPIKAICNSLDKMESKLKVSLKGTGLNPSRFIATAKTAIQTHPQKDKLATANRTSLLNAISKAAADGLVPDGRESAIVVYGSEAQYQPMVSGLVKLARKSGEIDKIGAYIVYEKDSFKFRAGIDAIPEHTAPVDENGNQLWFSSDRGKPIGAWALIKLKSGEYLDPVMLTKERIDRIATRSKQAFQYDPNKGKDWEEFWKKATIRNILKYAPKSTSLEQALDSSDNEFSMNNSFDDSDDYLEPPINDKPKTESKASKVIKEKSKEPENDTIDAEYEEVTEPLEDEIPI